MKLVVVLLCCLFLSPIAQGPRPLPLDPVTHRIIYKGAATVAGVHRTALLARAQDWSSSRDIKFLPAVVTAPAGGPQVVVTDFVELRDSTGSPWRGPTGVGQWLEFTATLRLGEGQYEYCLTDMTFELELTAGKPVARIPAEMLLVSSTTTSAEAERQAMYRRTFDAAVQEAIQSMKLALSFDLNRHRL